MQRIIFKVKSVKKLDKELYKFMKFCKHCGSLKLVTQYYKAKSSKDGYFYMCKECKNNQYEHICKNCGTKFTSGNYRQDFCSKHCATMGENNQFYGKKHTDKSKQKISSSKVGQVAWNKGIKTNSITFKCDWCGCELIRPKSAYDYRKNHFCSKECEGKWMIENKPKGENHPSWNFNKTNEEREKDRTLYGEEYKHWRAEVYERDNYTCQCCGDDRGHNLNAHHLDGYNWCKEKRTEVDNGITLCETCHKEFHKLYGQGNNTKEQYEEFIKNKDNNEVA